MVSGEITREEGQKLLNEPAFDATVIESEKAYVLKKLDLSREDFDKAFSQTSKYFYDYPSNYPMILRFAKAGKLIATRLFGFKPGIFEAIDQGI